VITADTSTPTKIVPAPTGDPQAGKFIQDRVANAGREQVVSKQEEPVAVKDLGTQSAPRVVLPAPVAPAPATAAPQQSASSAVPGSNEPKKVHTLSIRPDGADVSGKPVAAPGSPTRGSGPLSLDPIRLPPRRHRAGSWCNCPRRRPRPKRPPRSAVCKPNFRTSLGEGARSYGERIWGRKGCSTGPW
jgi:hypothetical protein